MVSVCLLFDKRRIISSKGQLKVLGKVYSQQSIGSENHSLLLPQTQRYPAFKTGTCSAAVLANGGLLTAGHCIRSEWLPGSVLDAGNIAATVWQQTEILHIDGQPMLKLDAERTWQSVELIAGKFKANGPDWALLSSGHNLSGYEIAKQSPQVDSRCHIIGYPLGLSLRKVTSGKVIQPIRESEHFFWLDCCVSNGVSGAPVLDKDNQLVGIVCGETSADIGIYTRVQKIPEEVISLTKE